MRGRLKIAIAIIANDQAEVFFVMHYKLTAN